MKNTKELLTILPQNIRSLLEKQSKLEELQEIRIKVDKPLIFQVGSKEIVEAHIATREDLKHIMQRISNYSIYAFEEEIKQGYLTFRGGHRIGISGDCVFQGENIKTIKHISSLNIRISREFIGCSNKIINYIVNSEKINNTIIISPPKCGKTTIIRDLSRNISNGINNSVKGRKVCVIDERSEIAACYEGVPQLDVGIRTDVYDNCKKSNGIIMAIRSMSPEVIICDEIGTEEDMKSILHAINSGVNIIATIHGFGIDDLKNKVIYKNMIDFELFDLALVLSNRRGTGTLEGVYEFKSEKYLWRP